ncbi:facilitated trehalose transporter Tret1-2 homolog isoform X2 [Agrilus planipennis]|uniref:Facilitated trehalose transporter Tret1-2 homolog isoform X2 n=1 Tax=Agrilus planipennis TaxID=224129 RepID=A0A1W4WVF7_AGRPL|nr:facilitated trehalose transporter Tret1-2 homolog isoform X2 [Agrilus planipennis]
MVSNGYHIVAGENGEDVNEETVNIYEAKSYRVVLPQLYSVCVASSFNLLTGMILSFSGIVIPELEKPDAQIHASIDETSWIASATSLSMAFGSIFSGFMVDHFGRLETIRLSALPSILGWLLIALAQNTAMVICGRIFTGLGAITALNASGPFVCEITWPQFRGSFLASICLASSLGVELIYLGGYFFSWKTIAWLCFCYAILLFIVTYFVQESPSWLIKRGRLEIARKSLHWYTKYQNLDDGEKNTAEMHLKHLTKQFHRINKKIQSKNPTNLNVLKRFTKPGTYKPVLTLIGLCAIQQFSGIYVITAYAVTFFENIGSNISPIICSNIVTGLPVLASLLNIFTMNSIKRNNLLMFSCLGMALSLFVSGIFTKWIQEGVSQEKWVPVVSLFVYMTMAILGLEPIPWAMMGEVTPSDNKGVIVGFVTVTVEGIMFAAIHSFRTLQQLLGSSGVQFLYGTIALCGVIFVRLFVPETFKKSLTEIEHNFHEKV